MFSSQREPFLWVHFVGLGTVPLWLMLCAAGFAVSEPLLPWDLEWMIVALVGVLPLLWMQLRQPFYIFSLVVVTLRPESLTERQCRLLSWFHRPGMKLRALLIALLLVWVLRQCYFWSPLVSLALPLEAAPRGVGLALAAIAAVGLNLFVQVPLMVAPLLAMEPERLDGLAPYGGDRIAEAFSTWGIPVSAILPGLLMEPLASGAAAEPKSLPEPKPLPEPSELVIPVDRPSSAD